MADINKKVNFSFNAASQLPVISQQLKDLLDLIEKQGAVVKATNAAYQQQASIVNSAMGSIVAANNAIAKSLGLSTVEQQKQTAAIQAAGSAAVTASNQQIAATNAAKNAVTGLSDSLRNVATMVGIGFSVNEIKNFVSEVIDAKSKIDFFKIGLDNIIGSERAVAAVYGDLVRIAKTTPFSIGDLSKTTLALSAMGVSTNDLIPTIERLGDVAALAGSDKLPRIAKAYTDVMNKGILMKQEINQFSENSIPIYNMLAVSMEKTRDQVVKLAEDHKIGFADVEKAFKKATEEGGKYYNMAITQSQTLGGRMKNLTDTIVFAKAAVGDFYEDQLSDMIDGFVELTQVLGGSESAIDRTMSMVKSFAAVILTYTVATKGALIVEEALAAARVIQRTAISVYIALIGASTAATEGFTASQIAAGVALRANPFGLIITLVGAATAAYYAFDAATKEVVSSLGEEEIKLKNQKQLLNDSVTAVTAQAVGTEKRATAMRTLISQYPEYFGGLSVETTNNAVLNGILEKVNLSYEARMSLARNAYQTSKYEGERVALLKEEDELMERIRKRSPELYAQVGGDVNLLMAKIKEGGSEFLVDLDKKGGALKNMWDNALNGTIIESALKVSTGLKEVDKEILKASQQRETFSKLEKERAIDIETQRWVEIGQQMKNGTKEYQMAQTEHEKRISELNGESVKNVVKIEGDKQKAKKSTLELSLENDLKELKSSEQTFAIKFMYLEKEEQLKKEQAKRMLDGEQEKDRILSTEKEYYNKRIKLIEDYGKANMASAIKYFDDYLELAGKQNQKLYAIQEAMEFDVEKSLKRIEKLKEDVLQIDLKNAEKQSQIDEQYHADALGREGSFWKSRQEIIQEAYVIESAIRINAWMEERANLEAKAAIIKDSVLRQEEYQETLKQIAILNGKISKEEYEQWVANNKVIELRAEKIKALAQALISMADGIQQVNFDSFTKRIDEMGEKASDFFDSIEQANKDSFQHIVDSGTLSLDQLNQEWDKYAQKQMEVLTSKTNFEIAKGELKSVSESARQLQEDANKFISQLTDGKYLAAFAGLITGIINGFKQANEFKAMLDQREAQADIDEIKRKKELVQEKLEFTVKAIQDEFDAFKESVDRQIAIEEEKSAKLKSIAEQNSSDSQLRLQKDDQFRAELLQSGEIREVAFLEAAKQRQIEKAIADGKSAEEVARITIAFDQLITDKHAEYQQAQGDKTKEISLANTETKAQEKDQITQIQQDLTNTLTGFAEQVKNASVNATNSILDAQRNAANEMRGLKRQEFDAEKKMMLLQIDAEIAKEIAKGAQSSPAIVFALRVQGAEIQKMQNPYFKGTEFVELNGNPKGIDTVPAILTEGERVITREDNLRLIREIGQIKNNDFVSEFIELKKQKTGSVHNNINTNSNYASITNILSSIPSLMKLDYSKLQSMGTPVMNFDTSNLEFAIEKLIKKPIVTISVSPNGARTEEIIGNHKKVHEQSFSKSL